MVLGIQWQALTLKNRFFELLDSSKDNLLEENTKGRISVFCKEV